MVRIRSISSTSQNLSEDSIACGFDVETYSEEDSASRGLKELSIDEADPNGFLGAPNGVDGP